MKKKYFAMMMVSVMLCSLAACGKTETKDIKEDTEQNVSVEDAAEGDEGSSAEDDGSEESQAGDAVQASSGPRLDITSNYYDVEEENIGYIYGTYPTVEVVGDDYPELKTVLDKWFTNYHSNYESEMQQYTEDAKQQAEDMGDDFYGYSLNYSAKAVRLDNRITSLALDESSYTGGAHGYDYLYGVTFDTQTGEEITFEKLGDIRDEIRPYIDEYIRQRREEGYTYDFYEDTIEEKLDAPEWYLNGIGLNIVFNAYDIASYAEGRTIVTIPYSEMKNFNSDYALEGGAMFAELISNEAVSVDVNGDGTLDTVELISEYDEYDDMKISLKVNDISLDLDNCAYLTNSYLVRAENGRSFVLISCDMMSDDYVTLLVEVTSGTPEKLDSIEGNLTSMSNDAFMVNTYVYVLGTYGSKRTYTFSEGKLQPVEERYTFASREETPERQGLVLKSEMTVSIEENGTMVEKELSPGTMIYPVNSDGETVVGFELEDGTYGEITFERKDSTIYIDGVSEYDLFEELPYAG